MIAKVVEENSVAFPWLNVDNFKYHLRKLKAQMSNPYCAGDDAKPT